MVEAESLTQVTNDELVEKSLIMIQQLFAEELIHEQERDHLKDMTFDEDNKLFGLMRRYSDP